MASKLQKIILSKLIHDVEYMRHVGPYLKEEYFDDRVTATFYNILNKHITEYKKVPGKDYIYVELENTKGLSDDEFKSLTALARETILEKPDVDPKWALEETEKYCREKAVFNAIMEAVGIIDGSDKKRSEGAIPKILSDALSVCFDRNVGHDYFENAHDRFEFYSLKENKITCNHEFLDKVTNGGIPRKTLNIILSPSGGGKSAAMCSLTASYLNQGLNVLYITMELSEERVAERIDANLFNLPIQDVKEVPEKLFMDKISRIKEKSHGKCVIKEFPTGVASVIHFRALLDELLRKKGFVPDVIMVDYLGIVASSAARNNSANSYTIQKNVAEELRGFAVENNILLWTAAQSNRSGVGSTDLNETNIAESLGIMMTADTMFGFIRTPELDERQHVLVKQIKNRFGDPSYYNKFIMGFDRARMKLYDIKDQSDIAGSANSTPEPKKGSTDLNKKFASVDSDEWQF